MNLSRRLFAPALAVGAASIGRAFAQADSAAAIRIPTGQVAGHAIARAIVATDGTIEVIAYYPLFIGVGNELWATAERSEKTAFFALRTGRFRVQPVTNGRVFYTRIIPVVGEALVSSIYYHPSPNRSFNRPETFSNGQVIVTFRNRGGSIMAIEDGELTYFSTVEVVTTEDFSFQSRTINLKDTGVEAYTVTLRGPAPRLKDLETLDSVLTIPLAGAFVAAEARR